MKLPFVENLTTFTDFSCLSKFALNDITGIANSYSIDHICYLMNGNLTTVKWQAI